MSGQSKTSEHYEKSIQLEHKCRALDFNEKPNTKKSKLLSKIVFECGQASENLLFKTEMNDDNKKQVSKCYELFVKLNLDYSINDFKNTEYAFDDI